MFDFVYIVINKVKNIKHKFLEYINHSKVRYIIFTIHIRIYKMYTQFKIHIFIMLTLIRLYFLIYAFKTLIPKYIYTFIITNVQWKGHDT